MLNFFNQPVTNLTEKLKDNLSRQIREQGCHSQQLQDRRWKINRTYPPTISIWQELKAFHWLNGYSFLS